LLERFVVLEADEPLEVRSPRGPYFLPIYYILTFYVIFYFRVFIVIMCEAVVAAAWHLS
jgi:hypothetical protein